MLKVNDFFCGAGGMGLGFKNAGFQIAGAWDFDKYAVSSYKENVGDHVKQVDISTMTANDIPESDVWTFGFPCQDVSVAGHQAGLIDGKRSGLFFEVMRLLDEVENKPKMIMAENVKGLKKFLPIVEKEYEKAGYKIYTQLFNSKYWGVPQNRERYFIVGVRKDLPQNFEFPIEQNTFVPKLSSILEYEVPEKYYIADEKAKAIIEQAMKRAGLDNLQSTLTDKDDCAYCCDASYFKGISPNSVGKSIRTHIIEPQVKVIDMLDMKGKDQWKRVYDKEGLSPILVCSGGGYHEPKILTPVLYNRKDGIEKETEIAPTLSASDWRGLNQNQSKVAVVESFRVRKLTPREYFRLQGFPDWYKFICSDSQLYKQAGNAVTVTVAEGIANSIKSHLLSRELIVL